MEMMITDLTGKRYSRWLVVDFSHVEVVGRYKQVYWTCLCDCGEIKPIYVYSLTRGLSTSCGCLKLENQRVDGRVDVNGKRTGTYLSWDNMIGRCYRPSQPDYEHYGGRGIRVCDRWKNSFTHFLEDMGHRPEGMTIDRREVDGNYEPNNCRWTTNVEQQANKTNTVKVQYNGIEITLVEAIKLSGLPESVVRTRYAQGERGSELFRPRYQRK